MQKHEDRAVDYVARRLDTQTAARIRALPANLRWAAWLVPTLFFVCGCAPSTGSSTSPPDDQTTPSPVSNGGAPPSATRRFEESDLSVSLSLGWTESSPNEWSAWSGGRAVYSSAPTARATLSFTGRAVTWIGYRSVDSGIARVFVDGRFVADIDLFVRRNEISTRIYTVKDLGNGAHTLTIEVTGLKNAESQGVAVVVDAFDVPAPVVTHLQNTDPNVSFSAGWVLADTVDSHIPWSGGSAAISSTSGAQATLVFSGTAIGWVGSRSPDGGIARVYLDGVAGEVDTYHHTLKVQDTLFEAHGLAEGNHTLTITVTGGRNGASSGTQVVVDAFDVTTPGTRFQEKDSAILYSGDWTHGNSNRTWSEGTASGSATAGARATFTFTGSSVTWIGCRKPTTGIARIYVDGNFVREIDTYQPPPIEGYQTPVFTASGLATGTHTLTIEATGRSDPSALSAYVVIDAIDVRP